MPLSCPCLAPLCFGAWACLLVAQNARMLENLGDYYFYSPLKKQILIPILLVPRLARCLSRGRSKQSNATIWEIATGRMPNPQTNNHQSRDGSGSGDRGRTFRPIETSTTSPLKRKAPTELEMHSKPYMIKSNINDDLGVSTEDIYEDMLQRQGDFVGPRTYNPKAHYLPYRRYLVDWMSDVGEQNRLHNTTIHVAILFMDKIFANPKVKRDQWQLLATACITVAAKYEEAEEHCPIIPELLKLTKLSGEGSKANVTPLAFRDGEVEVLEHLNWTLRAVPALHVVGYYLAKGAVFVDDTWQGRELIEKIPRYVRKYADFFCNLTMQEYAFQKYLPSQLASAILMASREALSVAPLWRPEMTALTGYEENEIRPIFEHVWKYYGEQFPDRQDPRSISPRGVNQAV